MKMICEMIKKNLCDGFCVHCCAHEKIESCRVNHCFIANTDVKCEPTKPLIELPEDLFD